MKHNIHGSRKNGKKSYTSHNRGEKDRKSFVIKGEKNWIVIALSYT